MKPVRKLSDKQLYKLIRLWQARRNARRAAYRKTGARKWKRSWAASRRVLKILKAERKRRNRVTYPNVTHYSENFTRAELNCKGPECAGKQPPKYIQRRLSKLAKRGLEPLRLLRLKRGEKGVGILSGYRCPVHNDRVNGAKGSRHMKGDAADIIPTGSQASWIEDMKAVRAFYNGGIGNYPNGGVHGDVRGYIARWTSF